jgi:hypothetical protein
MYNQLIIPQNLQSLDLLYKTWIIYFFWKISARIFSKHL